MANLENILIGIVLFSAVLVAVLFVVGDFNRGYEGIIDTDISNSSFNRTYNKIDEVFNISSDMKDDVLTQPLDEDDLAGSMTEGPFTAIRKFSSVFGLLNDFIQELSQEIGVPRFFVTLAFVIVSIAIIFGIIRVVKGFIG